jgi:pimeloyl-ACP methyl ester carboxylesterase
MTRLQHARVSIALHALREADGPALLCLHEMGGSARDFAPVAAAWPGRVFALDFCGHGESDPLRGGDYFPEILAGDADAALAHLRGASLVGVGVGAYVALLLAGARPAAVPAALLVPGAGLDGCGPLPDPAETDSFARWTDFAPEPPGCDPAVRRLERDPRPPDYARAFAVAARRLLLADDGAPRPPWWQAVRETPKAHAAPAALAEALALLAR